jgi:MYXO-CTERM domain-containing protein
MSRVSARAGLFGLAALCGLGLPHLAQANTIYTYHGNGPYSLNIVIDLALDGAAVQNIAAGTDIGTLGLANFTLSGAETPFATDTLGNPVGTFGITSGPRRIGTDALGNITSWDFDMNFSAQYPASVSDCGYAVTSSGAGDKVASSSISGQCRLADSTTSPAGTWTTTATTPLPSTEVMLGTALLGLVGLALRRRAPTVVQIA